MNDTKETAIDVGWLDEYAGEALAVIAALHEDATKALQDDERADGEPPARSVSE
ncbi:hypothetical protein [Prauserella cavernicola]|uniref:Uncharacterized protein n=1 Tax=Prauserella cavernicola TaxID=2800127 RepID=A0A934QWI8_9PSEU|nr:hypothetical protein [Prauserella cavernicola]MBK1787743.1 hypothetical protein [Prauserella cavernicola]